MSTTQIDVSTLYKHNKTLMHKCYSAREKLWDRGIVNGVNTWICVLCEGDPYG